MYLVSFFVGAWFLVAPAFGKSFTISFLEADNGPMFEKPDLDPLASWDGFDFTAVFMRFFLAVPMSEICFGVFICEV